MGGMWIHAALTLAITLSAAQDAPPPLRVVTANLRYAAAEGPHAWPQRRPALATLLREAAPDVLATQEGLWGQLRELDADLPDHDWIGLGREGGSRGEFMAIFYARERLEPLEYDHIWLSETPRVIGSSSWSSACPRMLTWVRFADRASGGELIVANTHLDHVSEEARVGAAGVLLKTLATLHPELPLHLVGDFNCAAGESAAFAQLAQEGPFRDTWDLARERGPALATFNGWRAPRPGSRIDWVLTRGTPTVLEARILVPPADEAPASDHHPVLAVFETR